MCQVLVASLRKWNVQLPHDSSLLFEVQDKTSAIEGSRKLQHSDDFKCLDRAATVTDLDVKRSGFSNPWLLCTVTQAEELKIPVRMFPIWATIIVFSSVYAQMPCLFVEQGMVLDNSTGSLTIPPASLSATGVVSVMVGVPIYDRILVPFARRFTGKEKGFSELQRMGQCLFISVLAMIVAALVEVRRLRIARENGQVDVHKAVPVSILWQIPHYYLVGAAEIFTFIGQPEFFYDQSPDAMRSLCSALALITTALGNYPSSLILTVATSITTTNGSHGWIPDNPNEGHLDHFFWLLAGLSCLDLLVYMHCAAQHKPKKASSTWSGMIMTTSGIYILFWLDFCIRLSSLIPLNRVGFHVGHEWDKIYPDIHM